MPKHQRFILSLYKILETPEYTQVVSWSDNGSAFIILDIKNLSEILKFHFKEIKVKSFFRQLQLYQFENIKTSLNTKKYKHQDFYHGMNSQSILRRMPNKAHDYWKENKELMIQLQQLREQQSDLLNNLKVTMRRQQQLSRIILERNKYFKEVKRIYHLKAVDIQSAQDYKQRQSLKRGALKGLFKLFMNHTERFHIELDFLNHFEQLDFNEVYTPILQLTS